MTELTLVPDCGATRTVDGVGSAHIQASARCVGFLEGLISCGAIEGRLLARAHELIAEMNAAPLFPGRSA